MISAKSCLLIHFKRLFRETETGFLKSACDDLATSQSCEGRAKCLCMWFWYESLSLDLLERRRLSSRGLNTSDIERQISAALARIKEGIASQESQLSTAESKGGMYVLTRYGVAEGKAGGDSEVWNAKQEDVPRHFCMQVEHLVRQVNVTTIQNHWIDLAPN